VTAWDAAVQRFEEGYGEPLDLTDDHARAGFARIFEDELRGRISAEIGESFRKRVEQFRAQLEDGS
jgi:hypothetical protein